MLANPELSQLYIGYPVRDGLAEVKSFSSVNDALTAG